MDFLTRYTQIVLYETHLRLSTGQEPAHNSQEALFGRLAWPALTPARHASQAFVLPRLQNMAIPANNILRITVANAAKPLPGLGLTDIKLQRRLEKLMAFTIEAAVPDLLAQHALVLLGHRNHRMVKGEINVYDAVAKSLNEDIPAQFCWEAQEERAACGGCGRGYNYGLARRRRCEDTHSLRG